MGTNILPGGYLPTNKGINLDHHMIWIKFPYEFMLGSSDPSTKRPAVYNICMKNTKIHKKYTSTLKQIYKVYGIP